MPFDNSTLPDFRAIEVNTLALDILQDASISAATTFAQISLSSLSFGVLTILVLTSIYYLHFYRRSLAHTNGKILLLSTVLLYASTTIYMAALIWAWLNGNQLICKAVNGLFSASYDGRGVIAASERAIHKQSSMLTIALAVNVVIGDAIVWWRACVIWQHKVVNCIGLLLVTVTISVQRTQLTFLIGGNAFAVVSAFISVFTNVLATFLIGYKAWKHKQLMKQHFAAGGTTSRILKALALLVESGCIYCSLLIFGIVYMIHPTTSEARAGLTFSTVAGDIAYGCFVPLVAIYPTIIIVLVAMKRSPIDSTVGLSEASQVDGVCGLGTAEGGVDGTAGEILGGDPGSTQSLGTSMSEGETKAIRNLACVGRDSVCYV